MLVPSGSAFVEVDRPKSALTLRPGTPEDFPSVARLSRAVYGMDRSVDGIRWLYERNPAGACAFWLAEVHIYHDGLESAAALTGHHWLVWFGDRDVEATAPEPAA
jgi:hypothetical protein